jgi:hypothetical protein
MPPVYFRNWDLLDGTLSIPLSTTAREVYALTYWQPATNSIQTAVNNAYVGVEYDTVTTAELLRYILFYTGTSFGATDPGTATTQFYVNKNDYLSISFDTREKNSGFATPQQFVFVVLKTATSDFYTMGKDGKWYLNVWKTIGANWLASRDRRFWYNVSVQSVEPFPVNGRLEIQFTGLGHSRTTSNEVHFKDCSVIITPYFNEKLRVSGYEQRTHQTSTLKNVYENQLFIANSDNLSTQGAVLKSTYSPFAGFKYYSAAKETLTPFSKYVKRGYWRSVYRACKRMEATVLNLYGSGRLLSPLNTVTFDEIADREFMITTMRSDLRNETSEMTFVELRDTSTTDDFDELGNETFKYLNVTQEVFNEIAEEKKPIDWKFGILGVAVQLLRRRSRRRFNNYS